MASSDSISRPSLRMLPFLAIARYEFRSLLGSWVVRLWLVGSAVLTLLLLLPNWQQMPTPLLVSVLLFPYLVFPWFLVVMVLAVEPVAGARVETLVDGILSRPVTRYEYLLASWSARVLVVLGAYLAVVAPAIALVSLANRPAAGESVTFYGIVASLVVVGLVLVLQVSLGFLFGTLLRRPLVAIVLLLFLWYPVNGILHSFAWEQFSPLSLSQALPTLLRQSWDSGDDEETWLNSRPDDTAVAEVGEQLSRWLGGPAHRAGFYDRNSYEDFSLQEVLLGYGLPTLACIGLATAVFCLRDL